LFGVAFCHLGTAPAVLTATENIPGDNEFARDVIALADERIGVNTMRGAALKRYGWNERAIGDTKCLLCSFLVRVRGQKRGIELQRDGESFVLRPWKASKRAGKGQVDRFKPDDFAILRIGVVKTTAELGKSRFRSLDAFESLFEVSFAGAAARISRLDVREELFMVGDVLVGECHETAITHNVDIGFRRIECDQFRALADPE